MTDHHNHSLHLLSLLASSCSSLHHHNSSSARLLLHSSLPSASILFYNSLASTRLFLHNSLPSASILLHSSRLLDYPDQASRHSPSCYLTVMRWTWTCSWTYQPSAWTASLVLQARVEVLHSPSTLLQLHEVLAPQTPLLPALRRRTAGPSWCCSIPEEEGRMMMKTVMNSSGVSIRRKDRLWDRLGTPERWSILGCTWSTFTRPNKNIYSSDIVLIFSYFTFFLQLFCSLATVF